MEHPGCFQYNIIIIVIPLIGEGRHYPVAFEYPDNLHHELYKEKLEHNAVCQRKILTILYFAPSFYLAIYFHSCSQRSLLDGQVLRH